MPLVSGLPGMGRELHTGRRERRLANENEPNLRFGLLGQLETCRPGVTFLRCRSNPQRLRRLIKPTHEPRSACGTSRAGETWT